MLNVVIFSGGSGSVSIQEGFASIYGNDNYNLDVIINAYDNGKSTGACRRVFNNKILGPSDLRKNHMTQFKVQKAAQLQDFSSRESVTCVWTLPEKKIITGRQSGCWRRADLRSAIRIRII